MVEVEVAGDCDKETNLGNHHFNIPRHVPVATTSVCCAGPSHIDYDYAALRCGMGALTTQLARFLASRETGKHWVRLVILPSIPLGPN